MELYTSLMRLKQSMNAGEIPPMTPLTDAALAIIDPRFTDGMGAITQHREKGLRCPVRGCGRWFRSLGCHLSTSHRRIGGAGAVRRALSIPSSVPLQLPEVTQKQREGGRATYAAGYIGLPIRRGEVRGGTRGGGRVSNTPKNSVNFRNLRNRCHAQLAHRLIDLSNAIGRSPSIADARVAWAADPGLVDYIKWHYGSWNAFKAQIGIAPRDRSPSRLGRNASVGAVLECLAAWHDVHGTLPSLRAARDPIRTPAIPGPKAIMSALGTEFWPEAMRRAASLLDIRGGRYGLPEKVA